MRIGYGIQSEEIWDSHVVGQSSNYRWFNIEPCTEWVDSKFVFYGAIVTVNENGEASAEYPYAKFCIDPNDYTKCLVYPEDL